MQLGRLDRVRYFVPTVICAYLAVLCTVLMVTSAFLVSLQNAVAVTVAGLFGLVLSSGLGWFFWRSLRRDLLLTRVTTARSAPANQDLVRAAALAAGWTLLRDEPGKRLDAQTSVMLLSVGERVEVHFIGGDVLIGSVCDPSVGFSLVGRQHCEAHRTLIRRALD